MKSTIIYLNKTNGIWSPPSIAPFSGKSRDLEAFFSTDGKTVFFSSDRQINDADSINDFDIWKVEKEKSGWGDPINLGTTINSLKNEFYPSVTRTGNIYFTIEPINGYGEEDIVLCRNVNGKYLEREILDTTINTAGDEFNAYVNAEETFIIFTSYKGRSDEQGGGDLYISNKHDNKWSTAVNIKAVNSPYLDYCPFVTRNNKTLFFASNRNTMAQKKSTTYKDLLEMLKSSGNSSDDIYWIDLEKAIGK